MPTQIFCSGAAGISLRKIINTTGAVGAALAGGAGEASVRAPDTGVSPDARSTIGSRCSTSDYVNPLGVKGIGELGTVVTAAAIANAVNHGAGNRLRRLPIYSSQFV